MLIWLGSNMGYLLGALYAVVVIRGLWTRSSEIFLALCALGVEVFAAWVGSWQSPHEMVIAHLFAVLVVLFLMHGYMVVRLSLMILLMMLFDASCAAYLAVWELPATNASLYAWRAALNITFACQCFFVLRCTGPRKLELIRLGDGHGPTFLARTAQKLHR